MAAFLRKRYYFFEILLIAPASDEVVDDLVADIARVAPQIRLLQIDSANDFDRLAIHGYQECIGDIVVLTSADELPFIDLATVLEPMQRGENLVRLRRKSGSLLEKVSSLVIRSITGFDVDTRFYRTLAVSRQLLSELLAYPEEIQLFRFKAHHLFGRQRVIKTDAAPVRGGFRRLLRRIDLVARLVATSAPRLLRFAAALCALFAIAALGSLLYVLAVWLLKNNVAEGWTTTTTMLGAWMFVQLGATSLMCLGLSRLLDRQERSRAPRLLNEVTVSDLFGNASVLNVEMAEPPEVRPR
ncbi:glucosyl transferase [Afifella sp. JA880]|uniref:glucosyl transferase n=1 Tax=Afifella sp. JA880 TaxID=2975280 RepID=UPI0021BA54C8|nr:glucosyl transferase [Afifella sp. JA880]MCT8266495.1 glucosyl transferase [Afifella sp. JA880]